MWFRHSDFTNKVGRLWREEGYAVGTVTQRIVTLQKGLQQWNKNVFGNLDTEKQQLTT